MDKSEQNRGDPPSRNPSISEMASEFAHGSLLEQYMARLERAEVLSPQAFIDELDSVDESQKSELLGELQSVRLMFDVGERMRRANPDDLFGLDAKPVPTQIGEFRILREVGRGGMGIVYEAEQLSLGRQVALKVLPPQSVFDKRQLERFYRESKAAAKMNHTNIVPVFGVGEYDGVHCYVMQFVPGMGLDQVLAELRHNRENSKTAAGNFDSTVEYQQNSSDSENNDLLGINSGSGSSSNYRLPGQRQLGAVSDSDRSYWESVARVGSQVAEALDYAHKQGVLHRDIKPSNLLLDGDGTVWVTDFGLAKEIGSDDLTRTGDIIGTLKYMAPECLEGKSNERADVYGLGATLYEFLTLRAPYEAADRHALIRQVMDGEVPIPSSIRSGIPLDLETIVLKSIAREPSDRYATAGELAADLKRFLEDRPIQARRQTRMEVAWKWCRRNPVVASMTVAVLMLSVIVAVSFLIASIVRGQRDLAVANLNRAETAEQLAVENLERAERAEREVRWRNHLAQAGLIRRKGGFGQRTDSLAEIDKALALIDEQTSESRREIGNELIADLALTDVSFGKGVPCEASDEIDIDSDFKYIAIAGRLSGEIQLRQLDQNRKLYRLKADLKFCDNLQFSPNGEYLIAAGDGLDGKELFVWRVADGQLLWSAPCETNFSMAFLPDENRILMTRPAQWVVCDLDSGKDVLTQTREVDVYAIFVSPAGKQFCTCNHDSSSIRFFKLDNFKKFASWQAPNKFHQMAWHPKRSELAVGVNGGSIHIVKVAAEGSTTFRKLAGNHGNGTALDFSACGSQLISNDWAGRFRLWDYESGRILLKENVNCEPLKFSKTKQRLGVFRDNGQARIGRLHQSGVFQALPRQNGSSRNATFSASFLPSSKLLLLGSGKEFQILDLSEFRLLDRSPTKIIHSIEFFDNQVLTRSTEEGVLQWPVQEDKGVRLIGPKTPFIRKFNYLANELDVTKEFLVVADSNGALLLPKLTPQQPIRLAPHYDCRFVAASPDSRWIATGSHWGNDVKIWNPTGKLIATLPISGSSHIRFSPNSKWLVTSGGGCRLWEVGSWREVAAFAGKMRSRPAGFSPDSRLLVCDKRGTSHVYDLKTRTELCQLVDPESQRENSHLFSPSGEHLVVVDSSSVWNIRRIREELSKRGLDWDIPDLPSAKLTNDSAKPILAEFVKPKKKKSVVRTPEQISLDDFRRFEKQYQAKPNDPASLNFFAWELLMTNHAELRNRKRGLKLIEQAIKQEPENDWYVNTLGVAYFYDGQYQSAIDVLMTNVEKSDDEGLPYDLYFIAMAWAKLNKSELAQNYLILANRWMGKQFNAKDSNHITRELGRIRAEAEALINENEELPDGDSPTSESVDSKTIPPGQ